MWFCQQDKSSDTVLLERAGETGLRKIRFQRRGDAEWSDEKGIRAGRSRLSEKQFGEGGVVEQARIRHSHELPEILNGRHFRSRVKGVGLIV